MAQLQDYENRYRHATFTRSDGVLEVRFHTDGGPLLWTPTAHREMADVFGDVASDPETKVVVLTGTGDAFLDAMDVEAFLTEGVPWDAVWWEGKRLLTNLVNIDVPVVAAVNGPATIHGEVPVLSDIVIASETATFADACHFAYDTVPGDGVHVVWLDLLGTNRGRYFLLTAQHLDAREALVLGVVNEVVPADATLARAHELAADLARKPLALLRYTRALTLRVRALLQEGLSHGLVLEGCGVMQR